MQNLWHTVGPNGLSATSVCGSNYSEQLADILSSKTQLSLATKNYNSQLMGAVNLLMTLVMKTIEYFVVFLSAIISYCLHEHTIAYEYANVILHYNINLL